jgi:hypothetical protein
MKKVIFTSKRPSTDIVFFVWPQEASIRHQEKYWNTGKVNHRTMSYSDDGLTSVSTQVWTNEGWEENKAETDPVIISATVAGAIWNKENGITTTTIVQNV